MFLPARRVYWRYKQQGQKLQLTRTSSKQHIVVAVSVHLLLLYGASLHRHRRCVSNGAARAARPEGAAVGSWELYVLELFDMLPVCASEIRDRGRDLPMLLNPFTLHLTSTVRLKQNIADGSKRTQ